MLKGISAYFTTNSKILIKILYVTLIHSFLLTHASEPFRQNFYLCEYDHGDVQNALKLLQLALQALNNKQRFHVKATPTCTPSPKQWTKISCWRYSNLHPKP